jgi:mannose-6-phosphate isomerase-like protein (cupin superfamily)
MDMASFVPAPGGTLFGVVRIATQRARQRALAQGVDAAALQQELLEKVPGLAETLEVDNPGMHTTDTIDSVVVLSGEVWLELDEGAEVHLQPGDCLVQNGTRHAWRNRGTEPCMLAYVMVGAQCR